MVQINFASREVSCKIVYYGPGRCGKTTNLQIVHQKAPPTSTGEMVSIATKGDRTLYFDFLSLDLGTVAGMRTRFHLYTVPGQVYYDHTRKLVLQGADGIVFVADSAPTMMQENIESLDNLAKNLHENGLDIKDIPLVLQWNKRDLAGAMPVEEMNKTLNRHNWPAFESIAVRGEGVFQTLKGIAQQVIRKLNREQGYSDDGKTRREDAKPVGVPSTPTAPTAPPPPPPAAKTPYVSKGPSRPAASAPPPVSAPQAPRSQVAPPNVPKAPPSGGPPAAPAAQKPPTIQPRSQPAQAPQAKQAPAQPRFAPPPPGAEARTPTGQPAVTEPGPAPVPKPKAAPKPPAPKQPAQPAKTAAKPAAPTPPAKAGPRPAPKPAAAAPKPAPKPPPEPMPSAPQQSEVPAAQGSSSGSRPPRTATKGYKVKHYPPAPEDLDMDQGDFEEAPAPAPPPVESATPPAPAPTQKSSGSLKSILLLIGLLLLAGAAVAVYQMLFSGQ